jgi:hypothetical protein
LQILGETGAPALDPRLDARLRQRVHSGADLRCGRFPRSLLLVECLLLRRSGQLHVIPPLHRREEGAQAVIILLQDGIELVVMTARAAHAQAEEHFARGVRHVGENGVPLAAHIAQVVFIDRMTHERQWR